MYSILVAVAFAQVDFPCEPEWKLPPISKINMEILVDTDQPSSRQLVSEIKRDWMDSRHEMDSVDCYHADLLNTASDRLHKRCHVALVHEKMLPGELPKFRFYKRSGWRDFDKRMFCNSSWALKGVLWQVNSERHSKKLGRIMHFTSSRFFWADSGDKKAAIKWRNSVLISNPYPKAPWD